MKRLTLAGIWIALGCTTSPAWADDIPFGALGVWDVSEDACNASGTSMTRVVIVPDSVVTYGGNATIAKVERSGPVTYVAADFLQIEGAAEPRGRERTYYRLTQRDGPNRLNLIWKDVQNVDLVRCAPGPETDAAAPLLPIPPGFWVIAGDNCGNPANASWKIYDGRGLYGAISRRCDITDISRDGDAFAFEQTCIASYDGSRSSHREQLTVLAPKRFALREDGESEALDFNWCGPPVLP